MRRLQESGPTHHLQSIVAAKIPLAKLNAPTKSAHRFSKHLVWSAFIAGTRRSHGDIQNFTQAGMNLENLNQFWRHSQQLMGSAGERTFQAFGATSKTSSRQKTAWGNIPWDRYRSESSVHASMSVGEASSSSTKAAIASAGRDKDRRRATRRFDIGWKHVSH